MNLNVVISTYNAPRSGRPIEAATPEIIVLTDRRVKMRELVEAIDISHGTVNFNFARTIGYEKAVSKMSAAFAHHKRDHVTISK